MLQFFRARLLETVNLAALWIDARHDVTNGAVLAGAVHALEDEEQGALVGGVEQALQITESVDMFLQHVTIVALRAVDRLHQRRPLVEFDRLTFAYAIIIRIYLHRSVLWSSTLHIRAVKD